MGAVRFGVAAAVLIVIVAGMAWLVPEAAQLIPGTHTVIVETPDGVLFSGDVTVEAGTPFTALEAAARDAHWNITFQGNGEYLIVTEIDGWANEGAAGWCYEVGDGNGWTRPAVGADAYALSRGQAVHWVYEVEGCGALG